MTTILIKALNSNGDKAIRQHVEEYKKLSFRERITFRTFGRQEVIAEEPLTLQLELNILSGNPHFRSGVFFEIEKALQNNGATKEVDYSIEVQK